MGDMLERKDPPEIQAASNHSLTMPPDLRLPPPGSAPEATSQAAAPAYNDTTYDAPGTSQSVAAAPAQTNQYGDDVYANAGISVYKPDGTRKTDGELREELRLYHINKKKQRNPNYGTVMNIGNIFKDE